MQDAMHLALLANLKGAMCALLRDAAIDGEPNDAPDGLTVVLGEDGLDLTYTRGHVPVAGEGV